MQKKINLCKSIIFLNGILPSRTIMQKFNLQLPKISADGAGIDYKPDYIIGDFDSFHASKNNIAQLIKIQEQETTDLEKCLQFVKRRNLLPSLIFGTGGGEIDHTLNNIMTIANFPHVYFIDSYTKNNIKFGMVLEKYHEFFIGKKSTISILPLSKAMISTKGLYWELNKRILKQDGLRSARNFNVSKTVSITVHYGKVMAIIDATKIFSQ